MKKFIMLSAVMAAVSTAFVACSSDDDLAQAPAVPEETVIDTPKGTPFSLSVSADTRSTLYNADAWNETNSGTWVKEIKVYGKQTGASDPWVNNVVFKRNAYNADWVANRSAAAESITELNWPSENTDKATTFYAITDGDNMGSGTTAAIPYVSAWMSTVGTFSYSLPTTTSDILWYNNNGYDFSNDVYNSYTYVTNSALKDLMVASVATTETSDGTLNLAFAHALAGLTIKAIFASDGEFANSASAKVKSVMVCGLHVAGTYTFGAGTPWATNTAVNYYYELPTPKVFAAEAEAGTHTPEEIVPAGTWLVIPQTVTAWDEKLPKIGGSFTGTYPTESAYIAVRIHDSTYDLDYILCFPLTMTKDLVAGKNRVITINIADGRDVFGGEDTTEGNNFAKHFYEPAQSTVIARTYNFDE